MDMNNEHTFLIIMFLSMCFLDASVATQANENLKANIKESVPYNSKQSMIYCPHASFLKIAATFCSTTILLLLSQVAKELSASKETSLCWVQLYRYDLLTEMHAV